MQVRVFVGVGAWLVGVGAATAGSLVAVALLGQGIAPATSQQLSPGAVNSALAFEATEKTGPPPGLPSPAPSKARPRETLPSPAPSSQPQPQPQATPAGPEPGPGWSTQPAGGTASSPGSKVLTSRGGTVVAECLRSQAYLLSWTPTQGYEVGRVIRGPAATAQATFESTANSVTMSVSCAAGVPTATTTVGDA